MIPETLFELCTGQKCGLQTHRRTDRPTDKCKAIYLLFFKGGHNKIHFYSYWDKKLIDLAIKHGLLAEKAPKKEKSKDPKFERLKTIKDNPRKVSLEDVETGEIKTFPSIYKAGKFIDQSPQTIVYWDG